MTKPSPSTRDLIKLSAMSRRWMSSSALRRQFSVASSPWSLCHCNSNRSQGGRWEGILSAVARKGSRRILRISRDVDNEERGVEDVELAMDEIDTELGRQSESSFVKK